MAEETVVRSFSWRRFFIKEVVIFVIIFIALALLWHTDLLTSPAARFNALMESRTVSVWHPFIWSGILYFFAGTIRLFLALIHKLQNR